MRLFDREIAEAVEDRRATVEFDAFEQVRMMADNYIRAFRDRGMGDNALILGKFRSDHVDAPVKRDCNDVSLLFGGSDIIK